MSKMSIELHPWPCSSTDLEMHSESLGMFRRIPLQRSPSPPAARKIRAIFAPRDWPGSAFCEVLGGLWMLQRLTMHITWKAYEYLLCFRWRHSQQMFMDGPDRTGNHRKCVLTSIPFKYLLQVTVWITLSILSKSKCSLPSGLRPFSSVSNR